MMCYYLNVQFQGQRVNNTDRVLYIQLISQYHVWSAVFLLIFTNSLPSEICDQKGPSALGIGEDSSSIVCANSVCSLVTKTHAM